MINFDCHAHIYETVASVPGARYTPAAPAPLSDWQSNLEKHGLKGGVIVQVSFLGTDNSELCAALEKLDRTLFAGVAVAHPDISTTEIDRLAASGVRGFRWNLVRGAALPDLEDPVVRRFLDRLFARDMHIEIHLEGPRLASWIDPLLHIGGKVVVDHFGLPSDPDPEKNPLLTKLGANHDRSNLYVKLSAPYRTAFDLVPHAAFLMKCIGREHLLWGSDWPHTQHENSVNYSAAADCRNHFGTINDTSAAKDLYRISVA